MSQPGVLVIDDDKNVLTTLKEMLINYGYSVYCASDVQSALNSLDLEESPEIIVLDYAIKGLDAERYVSSIKLNYPNAKIILFSGYSEDYIKKECSIELIDKFIPKPYSLKLLVNEIESILAPVSVN